MKFRIFNHSYFNSFTIRSTTNNYALLFYFLGLLAREIIVMHIQKMYNVFMYKKTKRTIVRTKANTRFNSILNVFIDSLKQKRSRYFQTSKLWLLKKYTVSEFFLNEKRQVCWARSGINLYICFLFRLHTIRLK